jgi:hypothetical protein
MKMAAFWDAAACCLDVSEVLTVSVIRVTPETSVN